MKKISLILVMCLSLLALKSQTVDSLKVYYYENYPYAYTEGGKLKGIEVDIIEEYINWLKQKKNVTLKVTYKSYSEFSAFYNSVKDGNTSVIGLGSITINSEREKDVSISAPYLQNVAVLITDGKVSTVRDKENAEVARALKGLKGIVVNKSSHVGYLTSIQKMYLPKLIIETTESQNNVLEKIVNDNTYMGYVDIVAYWAFLKKNPTKFLKIQKVFNEPKEFLGFILPKTNNHLNTLNEFFESGFGFTSTKAYHQILEKYLGYEIIDYVEIK